MPSFCHVCILASVVVLGLAALGRSASFAHRYAFETGLLPMALNGGRSVSFPRCVVIIVSLRLSITADDFRALILGLEVSRGASPHSRDPGAYPPSG